MRTHAYHVHIHKHKHIALHCVDDSHRWRLSRPFNNIIVSRRQAPHIFTFTCLHSLTTHSFTRTHTHSHTHTHDAARIYPRQQRTRRRFYNSILEYTKKKKTTTTKQIIHPIRGEFMINFLEKKKVSSVEKHLLNGTDGWQCSKHYIFTICYSDFTLTEQFESNRARVQLRIFSNKQLK